MRRFLPLAVLLAFASAVRAAESVVYRGADYALTLREDGERVYPLVTVGKRSMHFAYETHGLMRLDGKDVRFTGQKTRNLVKTPRGKDLALSYEHELVLSGTNDVIGTAHVVLNCRTDRIEVKTTLTPTAPGRLSLVYETCAAQTLVPCDLARCWAGVTVWMRGTDGDSSRDTLPDEASFDPQRWSVTGRHKEAIAFSADDGTLTLRAGIKNELSISRYKGGCQADAWLKHPYADARVVPWKSALTFAYALSVNADYLTDSRPVGD